jgi:hypothetical protein
MTPGQKPPCLDTVDYLAEVVKDWARHRFATAQRSDFALMPHRFELQNSKVLRRRVRPDCPEAVSPLAAVRETARPTAWCRSDVVTVLTDSDAGTLEIQQEIVEVLALDGKEVLAQAAFVARIAGFPPCLGAFWSAL